jgi:hypothetical protein
MIDMCKKFGKPNPSDFPSANTAKRQRISKLRDFKPPASAGEALTPKLYADGKDLFNVS